MNRKTLSVALAMTVLFVAGCRTHRNKVPIVVSLSSVPANLAPGGTASITATVTEDPANAGVNWTCTAIAPATDCGSFNPTQTASGTATTYTAPASTVGTATIIATSVTDPTQSASAMINISTAPGISGTFTFYLGGFEVAGTPYTLAGAVTVDSTSGLVTGEQDFNDSVSATSPQPGGDTIGAGSSLTVDPTTGQGTLVLVTNNAKVGVTGTETLAVQFVNASHALIIEFDSFAPSSGSLDLQTSQATPTGEFSFVLFGLGTDALPTATGGVFNSSGATITGTVDTNDGGVPNTNQSFTATIGTPDSFGRGTIIPSAPPVGLTESFVYYVVGPEAIRIIDVDAGSGDISVGSAFGQGTNTFSNSSLVPSVISISGTPVFGGDVLLGQLAPATATTFTGFADVDELGVPSLANASAIAGSYSIASNGYGSLTTVSGAGGFTTLGIYFIDPTINPNDPNDANTADGGGALVADMDISINVTGVGVLVPQTDSVSADFTGNYAFGAQLNGNPSGGPTNEADFIGQGTVTNLVLSGTAGFMNDPQPLFAPSPATLDNNVTFSGTFVADTVTNVGRYTMTPPLTIAVGSNTAVPLTVIAYQASAGQLFWIETDATSVFSGQLQQETALPGAAAKKAAAKKTHKP